MKEPFEDRMTKRIREVLEQYEPEYSPQAWEKLRKQMPVPDFWFRRLLPKYKFWFSGTAIVGVLVIVYEVASVLLSDKNSAGNPMLPTASNYLEPEKAKEITYSEKRATLRNSISTDGINLQEKSISSHLSPVTLTEYSPATDQDYTMGGSSIEEMPDKIERKPEIPVLLTVTGFSYQHDKAQLDLVKLKMEKISVKKTPSKNKTGKSKPQLSGFNSLITQITQKAGYDKFIGPNKLAIFYSPEMLHTNTLHNLGVSHGIGISFEGPVRSAFSISAGLSYQALDFHVTTFSEEIPSPDDPGGTIYIDSTIVTSGSYKYMEVPLSFNFKFFESTRSQLWFGTGLSSIIFIQQDYTTETVVGGVSEQVSNSSAKGGENVLPLASLNLSLLYRYKFSDRILLHSSIQYKPHLQTLGYNSMKLNRLNLQLGLVYCFGHKKK
jgi:hypothetical protein